jgi:RNA polymerase sigma factor for flagellar operon FliA
MLPYSPTTTYSKAGRLSKNNYRDNEEEVLITSHLPKVKYLADRMAMKLPPSIEKDDLYGAGVLGLIDAAKRFDKSRGIAFTTFAETRIRGAILDSLRALDWASRSIRKRARDVQAAFSKVEQEKGRTATEEEVAEHLEIPLDELRKILQEVRGLTLSNLDDRDEESGLSLMDRISDSKASPLDQFEKSERRKLVAKAIGKLPEREKKVIALYYSEELTMKEIGAILDITESRVSQLRTQAIIRLRNSISKQI